MYVRPGGIAFCCAKPCKTSYSYRVDIHIHPVRIAFRGAKPCKCPWVWLHSPPAPCYMCYMYYTLNLHSPPGPCYMCYMCYMGLTRQAAEPPLSPSSVLYVLTYSVRVLKYIICAIQCIFGTCWRCYVYSIQASIPYSTYSTYSKKLGESRGSAACLVVHIAWTWGRVEVQRVGGHIAHSTYSMDPAGWGPYCSASPNCASLGKAASRACPARVPCARLPERQQRPARSVRNAFGRASAWSVPSKRQALMALELGRRHIAVVLQNPSWRELWRRRCVCCNKAVVVAPTHAPSNWPSASRHREASPCQACRGGWTPEDGAAASWWLWKKTHKFAPLSGRSMTWGLHGIVLNLRPGGLRAALCYMYRAVKRVLERQAARVLYRGKARQTLPPTQEWRRFDAADVQPGLFWCEDLREVRRQLMAVGKSPKVAISSPAAG